MGTTSEEVTDMNTEGSDVSSSFTGNPEDAHVTLFVVLNELGLVDSSDSELLLDSRDERRSLEAGTLKSVNSLLELLDLVDALMELDNGDVLFTSRLLGLNESSGVVDADDEASSNLRVQSSGVTSLLNLQDFLDPGNDLMGRGVGWLVEVDDTILLQDVNGTVGGRVTARKGSEVGSFHVELVEVLKGKYTPIMMLLRIEKIAHCSGEEMI